MRRLALLTWVFAVAITGTAEATLYTVGTTADSAGACAASQPCSLRQLIARVQAAPFPPDVINVPAGSHTLDPALGALAITGSMTIVGAGAGATTVAMPVQARADGVDPAEDTGDGRRTARDRASRSASR